MHELNAIYKVAGRLHKVYNVLGDLICMGRCKPDGTMLSATNAENLLTLTVADFEKFVTLGAIETV